MTSKVFARSPNKSVEFKAVRAIAVRRCATQHNEGGLTVQREEGKSVKDGWNQVDLGGDT